MALTDHRKLCTSGAFKRLLWEIHLEVLRPPGRSRCYRCPRGPTPANREKTRWRDGSDTDKLLGLQGTFHSVLLLGIVGALLLLAERQIRAELTYTPLVAALLGSHLLLDLLDGGPIFLLVPGMSPGFGLTFPTTITLGTSPTSVGVAHLVPEISTGAVSQGPATYSLITGYGVLSVLVFVSIVGGRRLRSATFQYVEARKGEEKVTVSSGVNQEGSLEIVGGRHAENLALLIGLTDAIEIYYDTKPYGRRTFHKVVPK